MVMVTVDAKVCKGRQFRDPAWPPGFTCEKCGGEGAHTAECSIVVARLRGL